MEESWCIQWESIMHDWEKGRSWGSTSIIGHNVIYPSTNQSFFLLQFSTQLAADLN